MLFYDQSTTRASWRAILLWVPMNSNGGWGPNLSRILRNSKGVPGTYSTLGPHKQQDGAGSLSHPRSLQRARGCWRPILPRVPVNNRGCLGSIILWRSMNSKYSTSGRHKQEGGTEDMIVILIDGPLVLNVTIR